MTQTPRRVLGVDPGTVNMGLGVVEQNGSSFKAIFYETSKASKKLSLTDRLHFHYNNLIEVIKIYRPTILSVETVFFSQNVQSAIKIGEARALALLAGAQNGLDINEYPPARVKQSVVGNGRASKEQVGHMVKVLLGLKEIPEHDAADALANALCYFNDASRNRLEKVLAK